MSEGLQFAVLYIIAIYKTCIHIVASVFSLISEKLYCEVGSLPIYGSQSRQGQINRGNWLVEAFVDHYND